MSIACCSPSIPLQVKDRCVVARCECDSGSLLVKRHTWGGISRTLRMVFREPAALSCARLGLYLHNHGIPTPRPRATVNFRIGPWTYRSYLVSDYVEGTSLYRYIRFGSQTGDELRHVAAQVARHLAAARRVGRQPQRHEAGEFYCR